MDIWNYGWILPEAEHNIEIDNNDTDNDGAELSDPFGLEMNPVHDPIRKLFELDDRFLDVAI
jgi:hypothetical protein